MCVGRHLIFSLIHLWMLVCMITFLSIYISSCVQTYIRIRYGLLTLHFNNQNNNKMNLSNFWWRMCNEPTSQKAILYAFASPWYTIMNERIKPKFFFAFYIQPNQTVCVYVSIWVLYTKLHHKCVYIVFQGKTNEISRRFGCRNNFISMNEANERAPKFSNEIESERRTKPKNIIDF